MPMTRDDDIRTDLTTLVGEALGLAALVATVLVALSLPGLL